MADVTNLSKFLGDIADAIRTKKETTDPIAAENFDTEILSIEGGTDTDDATATRNDLLEGKTAYVGGEKITGAIACTYKKLDKNYKAVRCNNKIDNSSKCTSSNNDGYILVVNGTALQLMKGSEIITTFSGVLPASTTRTVTISDCYKSDDKLEMLVMCGYGGGYTHLLSYVYYKISYDTTWTITNMTCTFDITSTSYWSNGGFGLFGDFFTNKTGTYLVCVGGGNATQLRALKINYTPFLGATSFGMSVCGVTYTYGSGGGNVNGREFITIDAYSLPDSRVVINYIDKTYKAMLIVDSTFSAISYHSNYSSSYSGSYVNSRYLISVDTYIQTVYSSGVINLTLCNTNGTVLSRLSINTNATSIIPTVSTEGDFILQVYYSNSVKVYVINTSNMSIINTFTYSYVGLPKSSVRAMLSSIGTRYTSTNDSVVEIRNDTESVLSELIREDVVYRDTSDATAVRNEVLVGKSAYINGGKIEGTLPNNGTKTYTPGDSEVSIADGVHSGSKISAVDITKLNDYISCDAIADMILTGHVSYTELEYVKSTGNELISTDIICKDTLKWQVKFITEIHTGGLYFGATTPAGEADAFRFFSAGSGSAAKWYLDYGSGEGGNRISGGTAELNKVYEFEIGNRYIKDMTTGSVVASSSVASFDDKTYPFNIFGPAAILTLFYMKIYDGDTLVGDFIPVIRNGDNKVCLFDRVSSKFYTDAGSRNLIAGGVK